MDRVFFICSYGGCGSKMLMELLSQFGRVIHIHSRRPPTRLTWPDRRWFRGEWFGDDFVHHDNVTVIYIYRDPVASILSRFSDGHLINIQVPRACAIAKHGISAICDDDLRLMEFHSNYMHPTKNREYPIVCINFHKFWSHKSHICKILSIPVETPFPEEYCRSLVDAIHHNKNLKCTHPETTIRDLTHAYHDMRNTIMASPAVFVTAFVFAPV
jgi:hypothetical protein